MNAQDKHPEWLRTQDLFNHLKRTPLPCGCTLAFLPEADFEKEIPHEKPYQLLCDYGTLFSSCFLGTAPTKILEIGVKHGGSLALWHHIFGALKDQSPYSKGFSLAITGIDKEPKLTALADRHLREHCSGVSVKTMDVRSKDLASLPYGYDVIIDDGSHEYPEILSTLDGLWPKLRHCGLYVIEDWKADSARPAELLGEISKRMIGYWPDETGPKDAPISLHVWRDMIAIQKDPSAGED